MIASPRLLVRAIAGRLAEILERLPESSAVVCAFSFPLSLLSLNVASYRATTRVPYTGKAFEGIRPAP